MRWSPDNKYASLLVNGRNLGYVFPQTVSGIKVKAGVTVKELGRGASKQWKDISHESKLYAALGFFTTPAEVKQATAASSSQPRSRPRPRRQRDRTVPPAVPPPTIRGTVLQGTSSPAGAIWTPGGVREPAGGRKRRR